MNLARKPKYRKFYVTSRKKLVRCRCQKCKARRTLRKPLRDYVREPHCHCGGVLRIDWYRTTGA